MTKPIIYIDTDNLNILMESEYGDPQGKTDLTVEYTDIPYWAVLHFTDTGKTVTVYRRPDLHTPKEEISTRLGQVTDNGSGKVDISAVPELRESIGSLYWGCLLICDMLQKEDLEAVQPEEQEDDETHEENYTGILVRNEKGKWKRIPVAGKSRPDLMVSLFFGGEAMCRPYMEDVFERDLLANMEPDRMEKQAEAGDIASMNRLAAMYLDGGESGEEEKDPEKAVYWFRKAAEAGDASAMFNLALHLAKGYGTGRNFAEAAEWMIKAHKAGDRDALKIAAEYRMMAINRQKAEAGDPDAQAAFARALVRHSPDLRQAGADRDLREAVHWYGESYKQTRDPKTAAKLQLLKC